MTTTETARPRIAPWLVGAALVGIVIAIAWAGRVSEGRRSLAAASAAAQRGDRVEAIVHARAAAMSRCPFCDAPEVACGLLDAIAKDAEAHGDDAAAVAAWRAIRSATLSTAVMTVDSPRRHLADDEIARLEHRIDVAAAAAGGGTATPIPTERLREALAQSAVPSGNVFFLTGAGAALLLVGALQFVRARASRTTPLVLAVSGGALAAAGLLLF